MAEGESEQFQPRSRLISISANTAVFTLILGAVALWHNSQINTLQTSYINRIQALEGEIRVMESTNKLDPSSADNIKKMFAEVRTDQIFSRSTQTIGIVLLGIAISFILTSLVASIVVIRNRKAVKSAFEEGYLKGLRQENKEWREEEIEEGAEEFIRNYVQKGGE